MALTEAENRITAKAFNFVRTILALVKNAVEESILTDKRLCICGCGETIPIKDKWGHHPKYKKNHNWRGKRRPSQTGDRGHHWKGGKIIDSHGYVQVMSKGHPRANGRMGYVREHILVMEKHIGRYITPDEDVHHINGLKTDNRLENLQLMTHGEHSKHTRLTVLEAR